MDLDPESLSQVGEAFISEGLLATATFVAPLAAIAQEDSAEELGVMSISLADVVKSTISFQGGVQPNQAGIGAFLPLSIGENSVWFLDALVNASFGHREDYSSITNTEQPECEGARSFRVRKQVQGGIPSGINLVRGEEA